MKTAVVTGGARGIGRETALRLSQNGFRVAVCDVAEECDLSGIENAVYFRCDISDAEDRERLFAGVYKSFGRIDVLVNNAGVAPKTRADVLETTPESFNRVMDINLKGTFFMCQEGAKYIIKTAAKFPGGGQYIVNISSVSAYTSSVNRGEYCISKAGISMVTLLFADRLAEYGINVYEVRPAIILTDMTGPVKEKYEKLIAGGITPFKRFGQPSDVADAVAALCGGGFDFCTGQAVEVGGGFHIRRL